MAISHSNFAVTKRKFNHEGDAVLTPSQRSSNAYTSCVSDGQIDSRMCERISLSGSQLVSQAAAAGGMQQVWQQKLPFTFDCS